MPFDDLLAFDRASMRSFDRDGRLHVALTNISKSNVSPYLGKEIPGSEELGLDPNRKYFLYRAPEELSRAAQSFNNLPLLSKHVPVTAEKPEKGIVVGSTGTDAVFKDPYLCNSLVVWDGKAIDAIGKGKAAQISCAYHYEPLMEPGEVGGIKFDGRMTNIHGNHVALVPEGRVGDDIVVADAMPPELARDREDDDCKAIASFLFRQMAGAHDARQRRKKAAYDRGRAVAFDSTNRETNMNQPTGGLSAKALQARGALAVYLKPKLAADAQLPDLRRVLLGATASNWSQAKPVIERRLRDAMRGRLAKDQALDDVNDLLDRLQAQHEKKKDDNGGEQNGGGGGDPDVEEDRAVVRFQSSARTRDDNPQFGEPDPLDDNKGQKNLGAANDEDEKDMEPIMSFLSSKLAPEDLHEMRGMADAAMDRRRARDAARDAARAGDQEEGGGDPDDAERKRLANLRGNDKAGPNAIVGAKDWSRAKVGKAKDKAAADDNQDLPQEFKDNMKDDGQDRRFVKRAMDSADFAKAVKLATDSVIRQQAEIREAERVVRPYVGEMLAQDSAEDTYRTALEMLGIKTDGIHSDALRPILEAQPKPGQRNAESPRARAMAQDTKPIDLATRFPGFDRLKKAAV